MRVYKKYLYYPILNWNITSAILIILHNSKLILVIFFVDRRIHFKVSFIRKLLRSEILFFGTPAQGIQVNPDSL